MSLGHTQDTLNVTDSDGDTTDHIRLATDVCIELSHLFLIYLRELRVDVSASIDDVLPQHCLVDLVSLILGHSSDLAVIKEVLSEPLLSMSLLFELLVAI